MTTKSFTKAEIVGVRNGLDFTFQDCWLQDSAVLHNNMFCTRLLLGKEIVVDTNISLLSHEFLLLTDRVNPKKCRLKISFWIS